MPVGPRYGPHLHLAKLRERMRIKRFSKSTLRTIAEAYAEPKPPDADREFVIQTYAPAGKELVYGVYFLDWKNGEGVYKGAIKTASRRLFCRIIAEGLDVNDFARGHIQKIDDDTFQLEYWSEADETKSCLLQTLVVAFLVAFVPLSIWLMV